LKFRRERFMRKNTLKWMCLLGVALAFALSYPSRAAADDDDPPSRVARLAFTRGAVSFQPAGTDDWVDATVNRPMTTGDKIWSDQGSRAALHIGSASIHLSENTGFSFLNLTDNVTQLQVTAGTIRVRVKRLGDDENFEIDTPNLAFSVLRSGIYKIDVNDSGDTTVTEVRKGEGEVTGGGSAYTVHSGEIGTFAGTDELNADVEGINNDEDEFDQWSDQRDHHEDNSISARYVSDDAIGYDDLDDNGGWRPVAEYGNVWFPHTAVVGWAPYHYGHWAYVEPWGYTWVDDAAWGFAPFHYGRWVTVDGAWGWIPCAPRAEYVGGAVYVRPVYAPALVAWVGGPGFGVGVAVGGGVSVGVGWFPLGPREVYVPSYHVSRAYVENINVSNTRVSTTVVNNYYTNVVVNKSVNVTNVTYVNQRVPGAVAATSPQAFTSGQSVSKNVVRVDARAVASAPVNAMTPAAVPQREAVLGGRTSANAKPPAAVQARTVVAKTAPPPPPPSFTQRQAAIQSNGGRPLSVAQVRQIAPARTQGAAAVPQVKIAPPSKPATPQNAGTKGGQPTNANRPSGNAPVPATGNRGGEVQNNANRPAANANNQPANNVNRPAEVQNNANRPPANNQPANNNRPGEVQNSNTNRPPANSQPANDNRPSEVQNNANRPGQPANNPRPADRPPTAATANPQLEQQHQQQNADLQKQQQQERQRLQQQQQQQQQELQKQKTDEARQQQLQQQHQQQQQELQQKHAQEQQQLEQKQEQERKSNQAKPQPKQEQKPKDDKPPKKDQ
jgi:hypothetical protein